jgi:hypothetical protein
MRLLGLIILIVIVVAVIKSGDKTADQSAPSAVSSASTTTTEKPKPKEKEIIPSPGAGEEITPTYYKQVHDDALWVCMKPTFDRWNKHQRQDGHILLYGDEAEAQNGFGNWVRVNYRCEFDPAAKKVLDAQLSQGRLRD